MDEQKNKWLGQQIKLIAEGDTEAISRIYTEIGKVMFAVATIYLKDPADREDVVQDALLTIVRKADRFRENKNAYGWITKIVENLAKNKIINVFQLLVNFVTFFFYKPINKGLFFSKRKFKPFLKIRIR